MTLKDFMTADGGCSGASEKSIAIFEKKLGARLPADYRDFLLKCNGGCCNGGVEFKRSGPSVHHVLGLRSENHLSLLWWLDLQRKGTGQPIPDDQIVIMDDPGGTPICLAFQGKNAGAIFRWSFTTPKRLAASFADFVKGLREVSEDE
jgi:hypothetical protein